MPRHVNDLTIFGNIQNPNVLFHGCKCLHHSLVCHFVEEKCFSRITWPTNKYRWSFWKDHDSMAIQEKNCICVKPSNFSFLFTWFIKKLSTICVLLLRKELKLIDDCITEGGKGNWNSWLYVNNEIQNWSKVKISWTYIFFLIHQKLLTRCSASEKKS